MASKLSALCGALLLAGVAWAQAAVDGDKVRCMAALRLQSDELAQQVRGGDEARKPVLLRVLRQGAAFVGDAWLAGIGDESAARTRLAQAQDEVRALEAPQAEMLRSRCAQQADSMIEQAPGWQRHILNRLAQSRMDRLLQPPQ